MSWYSVRLLFEALHNGKPDPSGFFEDRLILVEADNEEDAIVRATDNAKTMEHEYESAAGQMVHITFREVLDSVELFDDKPKDFTEVYWKFLNKAEVQQVKATLEPGSAERAWPPDRKAGARSAIRRGARTKQPARPAK